MAWARDGSGLLVYRNRGRTVGQLYVDPSPRHRWARRFSPYKSPAEWAHGESSLKRQRAQARAHRAKRWASTEGNNGMAP